MHASLLLVTLIAEPVFIDVHEAQKMPPDTIVLDARGSRAKAPYLPGARIVSWDGLRDGRGRTGKLADEEKLRRAFERRGVTEGRPVLVYGDMGEGWGEEARIWWTLRYLGHPQVRILNGGLQAWTRAGAPTAPKPGARPAKGKLRAKLDPTLRAELSQVDQARRSKGPIIDARTYKEFQGETPYLSFRGGHIPGARSLHWKMLLGKDGRLLKSALLEQRLKKLGFHKDQPVIAYCTGGVRSAFVIAALRHLGFDKAANYDGSWWEWSAEGKLPAERGGQRP